MDNQKNSEFEPVCRFGPGGDFVSIWPGEGVDSAGFSANSLTSVLRSLSEIIGALVGSGVEGKLSSTANINVNENQILSEEGTQANAVTDDRTDESVDSPSASTTKIHSQFSKEPVLFSDDWSISVAAGSKPKHRIRAHRRVAKKRPSHSTSGQGTLFETDLASARTA